MRRSYTEKQVLKKLDIPDFRHLTKDKVVAFASMVPSMQPEVAKKALEQFPNFVSTSLDLMRDYKSIFEEVLADDREETKNSYEIYSRAIDAHQKILDEDNGELSFEDKMLVLNQIKELADAYASLSLKKSENRMKLLAIAGGVATAVIAVLGSALGSNIALSKGEDEDIIDVDDFEEIE